MMPRRPGKGEDAERSRHLDSLTTGSFDGAPVVHEQQIGR
jgi:hypothetical protein